MTLTVRAAALAAALWAVAACSDASPPQAGPTPVGWASAAALATTPPLRPVEPAQVPLPSAAPYLNAVLPADALAYLRVPSLWGLLGTPKGGIYDQALGSAPYVAAMGAIRAGLSENLLPELPEEGRSIFALVVLHARSPVEAALLPPVPPATLPRLLVTAVLDFPNPAALNGFLLEASEQVPDLRLATPVDPKGNGVLAVGEMLVPLHYSSADGRLFLLAGDGQTADTLGRLKAGLAPAGAPGMKAVESRLESGGQGLFAWVDVPRALKVLEGSGLVDEAAMLTAFGAGEVKSLALGAGSSAGTHRVKLLVEMPRVGFRLFVPAVRTRLDITAAGAPGAIVQLGLPGAEDLASLEQGLQTTLPPETFQEYLQWKATFKEKLGLTLDELLGAVGQELVVLFDEAGTYAALRLRDAARLEALIGRAVEHFGFKRETREVAGRTIHHLVVPSAAQWFAAAGEGGEEVSALEKRLAGLPSHVYYVQEGEYLLLASTPQPLIDRAYVPERTPVREWLERRQRVEPDGALLLATTRSVGIPAFLYDLNLQVLSFLGDLAGRPVDLFAFPTPRELKLPKSGAYSFRVASTDTELSVELAFEHNPAELLMAGNGYAGIAIAGILAGIAIPAYVDHTVRAQVAAGVDGTEPLRKYLAEFVAENKRFPNSEELEQLDLSELQQPHFSLSVQPDEGRILVSFSLDQLGDASVVVLAPQVQDDGSVVWECSSEIASEYLPPACR